MILSNLNHLFIIRDLIRKKDQQMKPIQFKQMNKIYAEGQKEYLSLPVYEDEIQGGRVYHCWSMTFWERVKVLFTGVLWINVLNFNKPLQPIRPMVDSPFTNNKE